MDSWWDLGEWSGHQGHDLALYQITCPFCTERGNFQTEHHAERKKPNGRKKLNFDTLKCGGCGNYILVLWSAGHGLHDFRLVPWPLKVDKAPKEWGEAVGRFWVQAKRNLKDENWDAASVMARSALQVALRDKAAKGNNLRQEIDDLADKGVLPPIMKEWAHELRDLGNDAAHPKPAQKATDPKDAKDVVRFLDFFLEYLYTLPEQITEYRKRKKE